MNLLTPSLRETPLFHIFLVPPTASRLQPDEAIRQNKVGDSCSAIFQWSRRAEDSLERPRMFLGRTRSKGPITLSRTHEVRGFAP